MKKIILLTLAASVLAGCNPFNRIDYKEEGRWLAERALYNVHCSKRSDFNPRITNAVKSRLDSLRNERKADMEEIGFQAELQGEIREIGLRSRNDVERLCLKWATS